MSRPKKNEPQSSADVPAKKTHPHKGNNTATTPALIREILDLLSNGKTFSQACRDKDVPRKTAYNAIHRDPALVAEYAQAREEFTERMVEEMLETSDVDAEDVPAMRLRHDAIKWYACRTVPKKYGERLTQELVGKDGERLALPSGFSVEVVHSLKKPENAEKLAIPEKTDA